MPNKELRRQIEFIWEQFWRAGIYEPVEILEQVLYLLFLRRLDAQAPSVQEGAPGPDEASLRWSAFLRLPDSEMFALLSDHVYPRLRVTGGPDAAHAQHLKDVRLAIPSAAALANIVRLLEKLPRSPLAGAADPLDYVADKLARVGRRGDFPTPHAIGMVRLDGRAAAGAPAFIPAGRRLRPISGRTQWLDAAIPLARTGAGPGALTMLLLFVRTDCARGQRLYRAIGRTGQRPAPRRRPWWRLLDSRWPGMHRHDGPDKPAAGELRCER